MNVEEILYSNRNNLMSGINYLRTPGENLSLIYRHEEKMSNTLYLTKTPQ